jgi:Fic family protein
MSEPNRDKGTEQALNPIFNASGSDGLTTSNSAVEEVDSGTELKVPPISFEIRELDADQLRLAQGGHPDSRVGWNYPAAVVPEIADLDLVVGASIAALSSDASSEIARFDGEIQGEFSNFAAMLLRTESASSSEIERLTASAKSVAIAELGEVRHGSNAELIVANTQAMRRAIELADDVTGESIIQMHEALLKGERPEWTGSWREEQVRIGGDSLLDASFIPPHHDRVAAAMDDLIRFMQRDDIPTLIQAAIAHAQFETIHPFLDGNGRTGRAIVHSLLRRRGLTRHVTVPVSAGLLMNPDRYFSALTAYREGNGQLIVERFALAAHSAVENGRLLSRDLRGVLESWLEITTTREDSSDRRLLDLLLRQPAVNSALVQKDLKVSQPTADGAIKRLEQSGILKKASAPGRGRDRIWVAPDITSALDAFGKRARRGLATKR